MLKLRNVMVGTVMGGVLAASWSVAVWAADPKPTSQAAPAQQAAAQPSAAPAQPVKPDGTIVYTFENKEQMDEFARVWQQRQAVMLRMSVLNAYWTEEQAALAQLNQQLTTKYHLDTAKTYTLNTDARTLIERPAAPAQPTQAAQAQPANPTPSKP